VFYDLLGKVDHDSVTLCFDMMQNLTFPRTPIGQAYYSRQLHLSLVLLFTMERAVSKQWMMFSCIHGWSMRIEKVAT